MKEFLLNKKYLGTFVVLIYVLIVSVYATDMSKEALHYAAPIISEEADYFLPITFSGGKIVEPENAVISRSYGNGNRVFNVVLDTRFDELPASTLEHEGVYFSRNYVYAVSRQRTEIRKLDDFPDVYVDTERFTAGIKLLENEADKYLFFGVLGVLLVFVTGAILLYTLAIHWLMLLVYNAKFYRTLRINTLSYIAISLLEIITPLEVGIITTLLLLALINAAVNSLLSQKSEPEKEEIAVIKPEEVSVAEEPVKVVKKAKTDTAKKTTVKKPAAKKAPAKKTATKKTTAKKS